MLFQLSNTENNYGKLQIWKIMSASECITIVVVTNKREETGKETCPACISSWLHFIRILPSQPQISKRSISVPTGLQLTAHWISSFPSSSFKFFPAAASCSTAFGHTDPPQLCSLLTFAEVLPRTHMSLIARRMLTLMISCAICLVLLISRDILGSLTNEWSVLPLQKL